MWGNSETLMTTRQVVRTLAITTTLDRGTMRLVAEVGCRNPENTIQVEIRALANTLPMNRSPPAVGTAVLGGRGNQIDGKSDDLNSYRGVTQPFIRQNYESGSRIDFYSAVSSLLASAQTPPSVAWVLFGWDHGDLNKGGDVPELRRRPCSSRHPP